MMGMEELEDLIEDPGRDSLGFRLRRLIGAGQQGLGKLHIPVAEGVPNEPIEDRRRAIEALQLAIASGDRHGGLLASRRRSSD